MVVNNQVYDTAKSFQVDIQGNYFQPVIVKCDPGGTKGDEEAYFMLPLQISDG